MFHRILTFTFLIHLGKVTAHAPKTALIIIDVQNCFTAGGTLEVADGNEVIPVINKIREDFGGDLALVVLSQDWHCHDHVSFASQHNDYEAYDNINLFYDEQGNLCKTENVTSDYAINCTSSPQKLVQVLWPDHCIINTTDAEFHPQLTFRNTDVVVQKGYKCHLDSYSAFFDNGGFGETELNDVLVRNDIERVVITGLATDFCVHYTSLDAVTLGYRTYVVVDATRGVAPDSTEEALKNMLDNGVNLVNATDLSEMFYASSATISSLHRMLVANIILLATKFI